MAGEQPNFSEISKDISTALADGVLLPEEEKLLEKKQQERCQVQDECKQ